MIRVTFKTMANSDWNQNYSCDLSCLVVIRKFSLKMIKKEVVGNRKWIKKPCGPDGPSLEFMCEEFIFSGFSYTNEKF